MMFSFSCTGTGFAPELLRLAPAMILSGIRITIAIVLNYFQLSQVFLLVIVISIFGMMFTWFMIFVMHFFPQGTASVKTCRIYLF